MTVLLMGKKIWNSYIYRFNVKYTIYRLAYVGKILGNYVSTISRIIRSESDGGCVLIIIPSQSTIVKFDNFRKKTLLFSN